jgi:hypothetical protein
LDDLGFPTQSRTTWRRSDGLEILTYAFTVVLPFWATWKCFDFALAKAKDWGTRSREPGKPEFRVVGGTVHEHVEGILSKIENAEKVSS